MNTHTLTIKRYRKANGKWDLLETEKQPNYNLEKWKSNILDSRDFFKRLGGTERLSGHTLTSISPDGNKKSIYTLKRNDI